MVDAHEGMPRPTQQTEARWKGLSVDAIERLHQRKTLLAPIPSEWRGEKARVNLASSSISADMQQQIFSQLKLGVVFGTWPQKEDLSPGEGFEVDQSRNMGRAYAIKLKEPIT